MMELVRKFFGERGEGLRSLEVPREEHDIHVATCALFLEMAGIDGRFSDSERERILSILKSDCGISDEEARALLETAREQLEGSIDLWHFTNLINQNYSMEEKLRIIETIWRIAYTDGKLDEHEDYLMHKLANLLRLTHKQLIDAKLKVLHPREGGGGHGPD